MPGDTILLERPGLVLSRTATWGPSVPYGPAWHADGERNHGFIDLRDRPELVEGLPEAARSGGLAALLRAANAPGSGLMSFGCECAPLGAVGGPEEEPLQRAWIYAGITFGDPGRCGDPEALVRLARALAAALPAVPAPHVACLALVVEPLRAFLGQAGCHGLSLEAWGFGEDAPAAWAAADAGAVALAAAVRGLPIPGA